MGGKNKSCVGSAFSFKLLVLLAAALEVGVDVEGGEHVEHGESVAEGPDAELVVEEAVARVEQVDDELQDLEFRQPALPAGPVAGRRQTVVKVQEDVDLAVKKTHIFNSQNVY